MPLPIPNVQNLNIHNCLSQLKHPEELHFYTCPLCQSVDNKEVFKVLELSTSPNILIFQLKRFNEFNNFKNQELIHFPITGLNISEHILDEYQESKTTIYDLMGVIQHIGQTIQGGHYVSLCKHSTGKWHRFNDDHVEQINETEIVNGNAYILIYMRQRSSAVSMIPSSFSSSSTAIDPISDTTTDKNFIRVAVEKETDRKTVKRKELESDEHLIKKSNNPTHLFIDIAGASDTEDDEPGNYTLPLIEDLVDPRIAEQLSFLTTEELDILRLKERLTPPNRCPTAASIRSSLPTTQRRYIGI